MTAWDLDDRAWFAAHPDRAHRIRRPYRGEFTSHAPPIGWSLISIGGDRFLRIPILDGTGGHSEFPDDESFLSTFWATSYCARHRSPWPKEIATLDHHMLVAVRAS